MNKNKSISGKIVYKEEIFSGTITFENTINDIKYEEDKIYNKYIIPGFIDLHCHGGNGHDSMEGLKSIKKSRNIICPMVRLLYIQPQLQQI